MAWDWNDFSELLCSEYCVNKCAERGDVGDAPHCPFTDMFKECEELYNAVKTLEKKYHKMRRSGVDEDDPRLVKLGNLYDRAGDVYDSKYASLRNAVSEDYWCEDQWVDWIN